MIIRKFKASVLVVTLIVLGIILVTALSVSLTSMKNKAASMGESKTTVAFQNAQSGIELVMAAILEKTKITGDPVSYTAGDLLTDFGLDCDEPVGEEQYAKLTPTDSSLTGKFVVELKKNVTPDSTDCSVNVLDIAAIKSVGVDAGQKRAIEAAVASTNGPDWQTDWQPISAADSFFERQYSSATSWYPSNCIAWFSTSDNPSGKIYPMSCTNNPNATESKWGWQVNGTDIKLSMDNSSSSVIKSWDGELGGSYDACPNTGCFIKIMLWK